MDNNNLEPTSHEEASDEEKQKLLSGLINPGFEGANQDIVKDGVVDTPIKDDKKPLISVADVIIEPVNDVSTSASGHQALQVEVSKLSSARKSFAVQTKDVCFRYNKSTPLVLNNVSINIKQGSIYGLLGPSGCGKTSLLKCLLDQLSPASGQIDIFGHKPGTKDSLVPGPGVGYMPQETALYKAFTIRETINYFGSLNGMAKSDRESRVKFLVKFLDLPEDDRLIQDLSGGQMRRVSLASALIHSPPLLVLDEPTVGVDPLLRESIWTHLIELSSGAGGNHGHTNGDGVGGCPSKMTIIITTHYIEEARRADTVCLFRSGTVLCEENPEILLKRMNLDSLEVAFLKICQNFGEPNGHGHDSDNSLKAVTVDESPSTSDRDDNGNQSGGTSDTNLEKEVEADDEKDVPKDGTKDLFGDEKDDFSWPTRRKKTLKQDFDLIRTLTMKGVINLRRNLAVLFFNIVNPAFQIILFSIAIGTEPKGLNVGVYNPEAGLNVSVMENAHDYLDNDFIRPFLPRALVNVDQINVYDNYSSIFLSAIDAEYVNLINYDNYDDAINAVKLSDTWAAITFPANYSNYLNKRLGAMFDPETLSDEVINSSSIYFHGDFTEFPIQTTLMRSIMESMTKYVKLIAESKGILDADKLLKPLVVMTTVYGDADVTPDYRDFMTPGFILGITFILAVGLTAISFVIERKEGLLERSYVAGVKSYHVLAAHVVIQLAIILMQSLFLLIFVFWVFDITIRGSIFLVYMLCVIQGVCGMSLGFMISAICHEEQPAMMLAMASFYPNMMLSGMVWPLEGMPNFIRQLAYFLPQTMAIKASRSIIGRGLGITYSQVYLGFVSSISWIVLFNTIALIVFAYKK